MEKVNAAPEVKADRNATSDPYIMGRHDPGAKAAIGGADAAADAKQKMPVQKRNAVNKARVDLTTKAVSGMLAQGKASIAKVNGMLVGQYRGEGGCKCIIGQFIPDDYYCKAWDEGRFTVNELYAMGVAPILSLDEELGGSGHGARFLRYLQMAHDNSCMRDGSIDLRAFHEQIAAVGAAYNLDLSASLRMIEKGLVAEAKKAIIIHD